MPLLTHQLELSLFSKLIKYSLAHNAVIYNNKIEKKKKQKERKNNFDGLTIETIPRSQRYE